MLFPPFATYYLLPFLIEDLISTKPFLGPGTLPFTKITIAQTSSSIAHHFKLQDESSYTVK